jgi:hypothetical protein
MPNLLYHIYITYIAINNRNTQLSNAHITSDLLNQYVAFSFASILEILLATKAINIPQTAEKV